MASSGELPGPYSPALTFSTAAAETPVIPKLSSVSNSSSPTHVHRSRNSLHIVWPHLFHSKSMTDEQMVMVVALFVMLVGIVIAMAVASLVKID